MTPSAPAPRTAPSAVPRSTGARGPATRPSPAATAGRESTLRRLLARTFSLRPGPGSPWPLFLVQLRGILFSKKTPFLLLFLLIPVIVTIFISSEIPNYRVGPDETTNAQGGRAWYQDILSQVFFPLLIPIVTAVYASGAIGEEVEGKTLPYLFTRPVYRSWILLVKTLSFLVAATVLGAVAVTVLYFLAVGLTENPFHRIHELFGYYSAVALAVLATGGVFLLLGVSMRRAIVAIVVYVFVWETILAGLLPANIRRFSFVWYERAYINGFIDRTAGFETRLLLDIPKPAEAVWILLITGLAGFLLSLIVVSWRDYNV